MRVTIRDQYAMAALQGVLANAQFMVELGVRRILGDYAAPTAAVMAVAIAAEATAAACREWGHIDERGDVIDPAHVARLTPAMRTCCRCGREVTPGVSIEDTVPR
jgi:hypothetical protein